MRKTKQHVIWSSIVDTDEWDLSAFDDYFGDERDDFDVYQKCVELNDEYLDDERMNLAVELDEPILAIADLGLWDGRHMAYKIIKGNKISDCLYENNDYIEWYVDELGDFRARGSHHDGTNYYLYREFKPEASEAQRENLLDKIYRGIATRRDITRVTRRIGDRIADVYGWKI